MVVGRGKVTKESKENERVCHLFFIMVYNYIKKNFCFPFKHLQKITLNY